MQILNIKNKLQDKPPTPYVPTPCSQNHYWFLHCLVRNILILPFTNFLRWFEYLWSSIFGTIWSYGMVGVGVVLLEKVCHCRHGLLEHPPISWEVSLLFAFLTKGWTLSSSCSISAWALLWSHLDNNGLNLWNWKLPPIKCCFCKKFPWSWFLFTAVKT